MIEGDADSLGSLEKSSGDLGGLSPLRPLSHPLHSFNPHVNFPKLVTIIQSIITLWV